METYKWTKRKNQKTIDARTNENTIKYVLHTIYFYKHELLAIVKGVLD